MWKIGVHNRIRARNRGGSTDPTRQHGAKSERGRGDRGVAAIEGAFVLPVLLVFIFGLFDGGLLFRSYLTAGDAVGDATRIGAIVGPDPYVLVNDPGNPADDVNVTGDYMIVKAIREGTASIDPQLIEKIVVFKAGPPGRGTPLRQVPNSCRNGWSSSSFWKCNVYPGQQAFQAVQTGNIAYFRCDVGNERACGWRPQDRNDGPQLSQIDYLGVYLRVRHNLLTGLFGEVRTLERAMILRLEPGEVQS
ncbi:MAG: hypothetical protein KatS3mg008_2017 [Acidimicrobiales bacterium]|nr:MAG: hypothetical protein KatS3mg008_2017 [Acidimicrobiales bacterium]